MRQQWIYCENNFKEKFIFRNSIHYMSSPKLSYVQNRFKQSINIKGTQQYHAFIPCKFSRSKITVKTLCEYSKSSIDIPNTEEMLVN